MIRTLVRVSWTNLRRDRVAQVTAFLVPIAFFSIFATIFGGMGGNSTSKVELVVVDESHTEVSAGLVKALAADPGLHVRTTWPPPGSADRTPAVPVTRARAEELVREGSVSVAMVLPAGIDTSLARFDGKGVRVRLLTDPADPIGPKVAAGLLQRATLTATRAAADEFRGTSAPGQHEPAVEDLMPARTEEVAVVGKRRTNGMVSYYAAGIAVMFLMFSATAAGGALIEETESGTLERVLSSRVGMTRLLAAKWLYVTSFGLVQITLMFLWGMLAFRLPLLSHLPGFAVMTLFTAACTASFGLLLATIARTRQQLMGMANLIVLSLSAIGGSMVPVMFLPEWLRKVSHIGFNAWALDGFRDVFWRDAPVVALWPPLLALAGFTVLFLALARRVARRWEAA